MDSCVRGFTISHATIIDYGAFNRTNFNTAMDHLTRLLIIRGINPLYGIMCSLMCIHVCACIVLIMLKYIIPLNMRIFTVYKFKPCQRLGVGFTTNRNHPLKFLDPPLIYLLFKNAIKEGDGRRAQ